MSNFGGKTGPLSRTGLALSLVILRGALTNMLAWVNDTTPSAAQAGRYRLKELLRGRVAEVASIAAVDWPHEAFLLRAHVAALAADWAGAAPAQREAGLDRLIRLLTRWLAEGEAEAS